MRQWKIGTSVTQPLRVAYMDILRWLDLFCRQQHLEVVAVLSILMKMKHECTGKWD